MASGPTNLASLAWAGAPTSGTDALALVTRGAGHGADGGLKRYQPGPFVAMARTIPRTSATMPPIHAVFARESGCPCLRNWPWATIPRTIAAGEQRIQQTIPITDSTVGVLDG